MASLESYFVFAEKRSGEKLKKYGFKYLFNFNSCNGMYIAGMIFSNTL